MGKPNDGFGFGGGGWVGPSASAAVAAAEPAPEGGRPASVSPSASESAASAPKPSPSSTSFDDRNNNDKYRAVIVDSGAIIKHSAYSTLHNASHSNLYYTVPGVLSEIRDAKARHHLETLPFELRTRVPSAGATKKIADFARMTGDYRSLSAVDMQVLALLYDLEVEGCDGNASHIRTEPKRTLGVGRVQSLAEQKKGDGDEREQEQEAGGCGNGGSPAGGETGAAAAGAAARHRCRGPNADYGGAETTASSAGERPSFFEGVVDEPQPRTMPSAAEGAEPPPAQARPAKPSSSGPKSWAALVSPAAAAAAASSSPPRDVCSIGADRDVRVSFGSVDIRDTGGKHAGAREGDEDDLGGQFDDAEESEEEEDLGEEGRRYADITDSDEISDEDYDVYVLDPEEVEERKRRAREEAGAESRVEAAEAETKMGAAEADDLTPDFPSLAATAAMPYDGSDGDGEGEGGKKKESALQKAQEEAERRREEALKPATKTKDGRMYNSFRRYGHVVAPTGTGVKPKGGATGVSKNEAVECGGGGAAEAEGAAAGAAEKSNSDHNNDGDTKEEDRSRIIGGGTSTSFGQAMTAADDDGEGWVTDPADIRAMKASGRLDPTRDPAHDRSGRSGYGNDDGSGGGEEATSGPPLSRRAACATTDFAMQNVILQMNLCLLTVDGTARVRRLKSWVTRCGACYAVYTGDETTRMFCERCGSDFMQRVAASVDGKTGRLRLHLSKKYKNNLRGTKFALPAPGKGNRFEGDLLLREDQLMYGAWNQKVKKASGKKEAQSLFGSDIASNVGCHADLTKQDDIKVGFGRRNPNSSKFGRERRGKKKKSTDKACGLRRY